MEALVTKKKTPVRVPMNKSIEDIEPVEKPTYDPSKNYQWQGDVVIPMLGMDFRDVFNGLKTIYEAEKTGQIADVDKYINLFTALQAAERTYINAIFEGIITEKK